MTSFSKGNTLKPENSNPEPGSNPHSSNGERRLLGEANSLTYNPYTTRVTRQGLPQTT